MFVFVQKNQEAKVSKKFSSWLQLHSYPMRVLSFQELAQRFWLIAKNMSFEASTSFS
jgi:hypothetical protein